MARPDLTDSDLQGLDASYRERCEHRRWTPEEANRAMQQTIQRDNKASARMRQFAALDKQEARMPPKSWIEDIGPVLFILLMLALASAAYWYFGGWSWV